MTEFAFAYSSIPNSRISINESTVHKILAQQRGRSGGSQASHSSYGGHGKQFASLFKNVQMENSMASASTLHSNSLPGPTIAPLRQDQFRYHIRKAHQERNQRIHNSPKPKLKRIIRVPHSSTKQCTETPLDLSYTLGDKRPEEPKPQTKARSVSYYERPYFKIMQEYRIRTRAPEDLSQLQPTPAKALTQSSEKTNPKDPQKKKKSQPIEREPEREVPRNIFKLREELRKHIKEEIIDFSDREVDQKDEKKVNPMHMFVDDDRDRFGKQIYPISLNNALMPGPGYYECNNETLQQRTNKINERNAQKRLVQIWQQQF